MTTTTPKASPATTERDEALAELRALLPVGTTVYTILGGDALNPYPNVGNIVPVQPNEGFGLPAIRFDADLLARLGGRVTCHFTGEHRAIVLTREENPDWWGLLMPIRGVHETAPWDAVQWLRCEGPTVTAPPELSAGQEAAA